MRMKNVNLFMLYIAVISFLIIFAVVGYLYWNRSDVPEDIYSIFHCTKKERKQAAESLQDIDTDTLVNLEKCEILKYVIPLLSQKFMAEFWIKKHVDIRNAIECLMQSICVKLQSQPTYDLLIFENAVKKYYSEIKKELQIDKIGADILRFLKGTFNNKDCQEMFDKYGGIMNGFR